MSDKQLERLGIPAGPARTAAARALDNASRAGLSRKKTRATLRRVLERPEAFLDDTLFAPLAEALLGGRRPATRPPAARGEGIAWQGWGLEQVDPSAVEQIENACRLPVSAAAALMPDAHVGYGLPIGGVLATRGAVIPYAVGVDIACRVKMTVLDLPPTALEGQRDRLGKALRSETRFGIGAKFRQPLDHEVMDRDWSVSPVTAGQKDKAWTQLGTSGSGNHFVEFGLLSLENPEQGLEAGRYLALLSHSGSRGAGNAVASHYSRIAMQRRPDLPRELRHLAWLDLDSHEGREYWEAMQLMGLYAEANHALIHRRLARRLGARVRLDVENHHNFAWLEEHNGERLVVHRKGAIPAARGQLGLIPGSMATPAYLVRGRGHAPALRSAAHGAGRRLSRKAAKQNFSWSETKKLLAERGVELLAAGLDEAPMAYKDIDTVMAAQAALVETLARFEPRIVMMAPAGERPED